MTLSLKEVQRRHLMQVRKEISLSRRENALKELMQTLEDKLSSFDLVLSFASFGDEIDLWPLNQNLADQGRLLLPKVEEDGLHIYKIEDVKQQLDQLTRIKEPLPQQCKRISLDEINVILVPGLGFDKNHFRIGYGKGHYDRLLQNCVRAFKVGVGFKEQLVESLEIEEHDQKLDQILLF